MLVILTDEQTKAYLDRIVHALENIDRNTRLSLKQGAQLMSVLDDIEAEVANSTTVEQSVETLIANLVTTIQNSDPNNARLATVLATLQANDTRLAQLVTQNTPVQAPSVEPPTPPAQA
jgi:hypothetical protein